MKTFQQYLEQKSEIILFKDLGLKSLYHKGELNTADQIDPFRIASKQNKKGRSYGGFYVGSLDHAKTYPGSMLLKIEIDPNAKVLEMKNLGSTDRLDISVLKSYANEGIDMIWGKDIRGLEQGLILNTKVITAIHPSP